MCVKFMNLCRGARNSQGSVNHAHCSVAVSRYLGSKAVKLFKVRMHGSDAVSTCCHLYTIEIKLTIAGSQVKLSPSAGKGHVIINFFQTGNRDFRVENREFKVENREFKVENREFKVEIRDFKVAIASSKWRSRLQSGKLRLQSGESRLRSGEHRLQSGQSRVF